MKKVFVLLNIFIFIICPFLSAELERIAVVVSRTAEAYETAKNGITWNCGYDIDLFNMEGDRFKGERIMKRFDSRFHKAVIAIGSEAANLVCHVNESIPVVYTMVLKQVSCGEKRTLHGVIIKIDVEEQIILIKRIFPKTQRIGVLYNPANSKEDIKQALETTERLQMSLIAIEVSDRDSISKGMKRLKDKDIDVLWLVIDKTIIHPLSIKQFIKFSQFEDIPLFGLSIYHVKAGAFAAFSVDFYTIGEQSANLLEKVKKNEASQRIEKPNLTILYVNKKLEQRWMPNINVEEVEIRRIE